MAIPKQRPLFIEPACGLGNRLQFMLGGIQAAELLEREPVIVWQHDPLHLACPFDELFDSRLRVVETKSSLLSSPELVRRLVPNGDVKAIAYIDSPGVLHRLDVEQMSAVVLQGARMLALEGQTSDDVETRMATAFDSHLTIAKSLRAAIQDVLSSPIRSLDLGVHVRRGDITIGHPRYIDERQFFPAIDQHFPQGQIVLCTESPQVKQAFRHRYGRRVVTSEPHAGRGSQATKDALVDFSLLSRCENILATRSSFSRVASIVGRCKLICLSEEPCRPMTDDR